MLCAVAAACGGGDRPAGGLPGYVPTPEAAEPAPEGRSPRRLRRLTNLEMEEVIVDLLGGERLPLGGTFLPDPRAEGYDNDATTLGVTESKVEEIVMTAERVAAHLTDGDNLARFAPCPPGQDEVACARAFVARAAARVWGRPASADELQRLAGVFEVGRTGAQEGYRGGIALLTQAVLQSPHFIYRTELGGPAGGDGPVALSELEIASAMSFLLRGSRPDDDLLDAALRGELSSPAAREREARRLLASAQGRRRMTHFVRAWLGLADVAMINKDVGAFPFFTPRARRALDRELNRFVDHVLAEEGARLDELMLADYTFPGPEHVAFYADELSQPPGDFERRPLDARKRRGLLSSPAFLATHALIDNSNPVERGLMVRTRLFCQDVAPPPPDVLGTIPAGGPETTTRQRYENHVRDPGCRTCHMMMDSLGFGFEHFDAAGRYRSVDNGHPIDAQGQIVFTDIDGPFYGPAELAQRLVLSAQFRRCFVKQAYRYAEGRSLDGSDEPEIDHLASLFEKSGHRIDELFMRLVRRPSFVLRKPAPEEGP
jgi:hypothetical protein